MERKKTTGVPVGQEPPENPDFGLSYEVTDEDRKQHPGLDDFEIEILKGMDSGEIKTYESDGKGGWREIDF
jgi:hypothetical protein